METHDDPFRWSLVQLIAELETLITDESHRSGTFWIYSTKLAELFDCKYQASLEEVSKAQGYNSLRSLLRSSRCFSIRSTPIPRKFHIALAKNTIPNFDQTSIGMIPYRIKKSFNVDPNLIRMLQEEGAEEVSSQPFQTGSVWRKQPPISGCQPISLPDIVTVDDLTTAIAEIVRWFIRDRRLEFVTIAMLSQQFRVFYQEPIRVSIRRVCPGMRLINLLQMIPNLQVQGVNYAAQITLKD